MNADDDERAMRELEGQIFLDEEAERVFKRLEEEAEEEEEEEDEEEELGNGDNEEEEEEEKTPVEKNGKRKKQ